MKQSLIRRPFRYSYVNAVLFLVGANILVFLGQRVFPLTYLLSMNPADVVINGRVWQFFSYMFVHGNFRHILFNMLALFIFGTQVERQMGSKEFLLFYLVTGTLAGVLSFALYFFTGQYGVLLMGASGAIFAVEFAYATFFPHSVIYIWGIIPVRAPLMVLGFTALELFSSVTGLRSGVAHFTHLSGFAFAWLYFLVRYGVNPWHYLTRRK